MKKEYITPELECISLETSDVITASNVGGGKLPGEGEWDNDNWN